MNAELNNAKQRLRSAHERAIQPAPRLEAAKARLRSTAAGFDRMGDEIVRHLGMAELADWVSQDPWKAIFAATAGGFFAGKLKDNEVLLLSLLLRLLDLVSAESRKPPPGG